MSEVALEEEVSFGGRTVHHSVGQVDWTVLRQVLVHKVLIVPHGKFVILLGVAQDLQEKPSAAQILKKKWVKLKVFINKTFDNF
jgi:hypothetical protein